MTDIAIHIKNLCKIYNKGQSNQHVALDDVSLSIKKGSIFALLGPNGAGKSTLINIIAGLVFKTSGYVNIWGIDIDKNHRNAKLCVGIVPQELNVDPFFVPQQLLDIHAGLYGVSKSQRRTHDILKMIDLEDKANTYARNLSGGMRRRLLMGKAMVHNPPILILDEPTAGVDIELRHKLWQNVKHLNENGVTILLTTHYLEEAEELCDHIAIINKGKLVVNDTKKSLMQKIDQRTIIIYTKEDFSHIAIRIPHATINYQQKQDERFGIHIDYIPSKMNAGDIISYFTNHDIPILDIATRDPDLEDVFLKHTQQYNENKMVVT